MSRFDYIDPATLPKPEVLQELAYEAIRTELIAAFQLLYPDFTAALESDPVVKLLELAAYREVHWRARTNDDARRVMPAYATGADLEHIGARYGVSRLLLDAGDPLATPPVPPTYEDDEALRRRILLSPEALSVAGSRGGYIFNTLSAGETPANVAITSPQPGTVITEYTFDPVGIAAQVKHANAFQSNPGEITVVVMGWDGDGIPTMPVLSAVEAHLTDAYVRPMGDTVIVKAVDVVSYTIDATIEVTEGPQIPLAQTAAEDALQDYVNARHAIGLRVTESGIHEALTVAGVDKVTLTGFNDIEPTGEQAAYCTGFTVNVVVQNV